MVYLHCFDILFMGIWGMVIVVIVHIKKKTKHWSGLSVFRGLSSLPCVIFSQWTEGRSQNMHCFPIKDNLVISIIFPFSVYPFNWPVFFFLMLPVLKLKRSNIATGPKSRTLEIQNWGLLSLVFYLCVVEESLGLIFIMCNKGYGVSFCRASIHF